MKLLAALIFGMIVYHFVVTPFNRFEQRVWSRADSVLAAAKYAPHSTGAAFDLGVK